MKISSIEPIQRSNAVTGRVHRFQHGRHPVGDRSAGAVEQAGLRPAQQHQRPPPAPATMTSGSWALPRAGDLPGAVGHDDAAPSARAVQNAVDRT